MDLDETLIEGLLGRLLDFFTRISHDVAIDVLSDLS